MLVNLSHPLLLCCSNWNHNDVTDVNILYLNGLSVFQFKADNTDEESDNTMKFYPLKVKDQECAEGWGEPRRNEEVLPCVESYIASSPHLRQAALPGITWYTVWLSSLSVDARRDLWRIFSPPTTKCLHSYIRHHESWTSEHSVSFLFICTWQLTGLPAMHVMT